MIFNVYERLSKFPLVLSPFSSSVSGLPPLLGLSSVELSIRASHSNIFTSHLIAEASERNGRQREPLA